jgi:hypothetical protein
MVIHIFLQPLRIFYNLEDLWSEAPKIQVDLDHDSPQSQESLFAVKD